MMRLAFCICVAADSFAMNCSVLVFCKSAACIKQFNVLLYTKLLDIVCFVVAVIVAFSALTVTAGF